MLTGKSALLDGQGEPWRENASGSKLWDYLGLARVGQVGYHPELLGADETHCQTYLHILDGGHPVFEGFEKTQVITFGGILQKVVSNGALKQIAGWIPGIPITPNEYSYPKQICDEVGTVFAGVLPSGSRVVYLAGDVDRLYAANELPDHARLLQNAVNWTLADRRLIRVTGPGYVDVKVYRQKERMIVHLSNITGSNTRFGYADEFLPVGPLRVTLACAAGKNLAVTAHVCGETLPYVQTQDGIAFTIERLITHEMVVAEPRGRA